MSGCRYRKCQPQLCRFARNSKDLREEIYLKSLEFLAKRQSCGWHFRYRHPDIAGNWLAHVFTGNTNPLKIKEHNWTVPAKEQSTSQRPLKKKLAIDLQEDTTVKIRDQEGKSSGKKQNVIVMFISFILIKSISPERCSSLVFSINYKRQVDFIVNLFVSVKKIFMKPGPQSDKAAVGISDTDILTLLATGWHLVSCLKEEDEENLAKMEQSTSQRPLKKKLAIDLQEDTTVKIRGYAWGYASGKNSKIFQDFQNLSPRQRLKVDSRERRELSLRVSRNLKIPITNLSPPPNSLILSPPPNSLILSPPPNSLILSPPPPHLPILNSPPTPNLSHPPFPTQIPLHLIFPSTIPS
ncbi:hypothetical protein T08_6042 [Trichinella sp. T8]|nr:hypothetical protein T08_6042 [Trichinella sp. T8]